METDGQSVPADLSGTDNAGWASRLLGQDSLADLFFVCAIFATYFILDRWTALLATLRPSDLGQYSLIGSAFGNRWVLWVLLILASGTLCVAKPRRMFGAWSDLDDGNALRVLAIFLIVLLGWQASLYNINFLANQTHSLDRIAVAALGLIAIWRPLAIVPFVVAVRVINEQFLFPFGTVVSKNVDELLAVVLLAFATSHLLFVFTKRSTTSPTILLVGSAVASHFFWPGVAKMTIGWIVKTDLSNLPISSRTAGWLGGTSGGLAETMASLFDRFGVVILVATLIIEVGALAAAAHPKALRLWLPFFAAFHFITFLSTGFFFIGWTIVELVLLTYLTLPRFGQWVRENTTVARGAIAVAAVLGGPVLFHPPGLAWFDAPVSYGYEMHATGVSRTEYNLALSSLDPYSQEAIFLQAQLADHRLATSGYGALSDPAELDELNEVSNFEMLAIYESRLGPAEPDAQSQDLFVDFFNYVNEGAKPGWRGLSHPDRFWVSAPGPLFDYSEPLDRLEVTLLTTLHRNGQTTERREVVLVVQAQPDGTGTIISFP